MAKTHKFHHNNPNINPDCINKRSLTLSIAKNSPSPQHLSGESYSLDTRDLQPGLYIVSTPIGHLRDITLRALDILHGCEHILAEDTRQTRKLCEAYSIKTPLSAYHDHNAAKRVPDIIERLNDGATLALVSDAGTPLVSDPGFRLVRAAVEAGIDIWPIPGASSVLAALVKSGLPSDAFYFHGFLPPKTSARKTTLTELASIKATLVFFTTGPRIQAVLSDALEVLGNRPAVITRELTKRYEESRHNTLEALIGSVKETPPKGEIVLLVSPPTEKIQWDEAEIRHALPEHINEIGVKRASAKVADLSGWTKRDVYAVALTL